MKIITPHCPKCGRVATATTETDIGMMLMAAEPWPAYVETDWNQEQTILETDQDVLLLCPNGHEWTSQIQHQ